MNKIQGCLLGTGIMILSLFSCGKKDQLGPGISGIYGPLTIVTTLDKSMDNPQFSNGDKVYFTASFQNDAVWTLTLTGQSTGAVKTFSGIGKSVNGSNTLWNGSADDAPSFAAELVDVMLTFPNSINDTLRTTLTIAVPKTEADEVLVSDFNVTKITSAGATTGWPSDWPVTNNTHMAYGYPDGTRYLYMTGNPWQGGTPSNSPYVDFITIPAKEADTNWGTYFPLYADPSKVYFNMMMYNTGTANTWLKIVFFEDGKAARYIDIKNISWMGWKQLSYNYLSTLSTEASNPAPKPNKITAVQFVLLSGKASGPWPATDVVSTAFDHVTFTNNQPYQP